MTDNEIIKGLEHCGIEANCKGCPYHDISFCQDEVDKDALDLIKRQQTKIEKLEYIREKQAERIVALKMAKKSNMDRIVEQLEKESYDSMHLDMSRPMTETWQIIDLDKAIEIVNAGGKENK